MAARMSITLLKTKSSPIDPYDEYFSAHPFDDHPDEPSCLRFVPVLRHQYVNLDRVERLVMEGKTATTTTATAGEEGAGEGAYAGLIITSQRAVEALGSVLEKLRGTQCTSPRGLIGKAHKAGGSAREETKAFLADTIVYVVGPATSAAVQALGFQHGNVRGEQCGNGIALAHFILADCDSAPRPGRQRALLFLNNERRGNDIPGILSHDAAPDDRRVRLAELVVYETGVVAEFAEEFRQAMRATTGLTRWVVVFSPTGADVAWKVLSGGGVDGDETETESGRTYWASIGPTTERHLVEAVGRRPDVVAKKPSPQGLWQAINEFMKGRSS